MNIQRRVWLAVVACAVVLTAIVLPIGTAVRDGPSIQVVAHRVPLDGQDATLGRGAEADLRLQEALIADRLGTLRVDGAQVHYQHEAAHRGALVTRREDLRDDVFGARAVPEGDRVLVLSGLDALDDARRASELEQACALDTSASQVGQVRWATVATVDAVGVWISQGDRVHTVLVPDVEGAERPVGDAVLRRTSEGLELAAGTVVHPVPTVFVRELGEEIAQALRAEATFGPGPIEAGRVVKDRAFLVVGDHEPAVVQPGGLAGSTFDLGGGHEVFLFRKGPGGETIKPWFVPVDAALSALDRPAAIQLARTPDHAASVHVFDCATLPDCLAEGEDCPAEVGTTTLGEGDWLVAGAGVHYRVELEAPTPDDAGALQLALVLPPAGRVRLLSSLSAGRLQAWGPRVEVPECSGEDAGRLVLRGTTDESILPQGVSVVPGAFVRAPSDSLLDVPLPRRFAQGLPEVGQGILDVPLGAACVREDGLVVRALHDQAASTRVAPGETFELAGHVFRYWDHQPTREQRIPLVGFLLGVLFFFVAALRELTGVATRGGQGALPLAPTLGLAAVAVLLSAGGALQMHMAASDALLGSPDYVQRHLITGYGAAVVLWLGARLGHRWRREGFWALVALTLRTLAIGAVGLSVWATLDAALWAWIGPPLDQVPADEVVVAAVRRSVATVWVVSALLAGAAFATGRLSDRAAPAWLRGRPALAMLGRIGQKYRAIGFLMERPAGEDQGGFGRTALLLGLVVLVVGAALDVVVGSRWLAGFDLKPAEFTPTLIGLGIAGMLAGFSREQSSDWWRVPARALGWTAVIGALLLLCYGARADLGPLMVIVPSVVTMLAVWSFPWSPAQHRKGRVGVRLGVFAITLLALFGFVEGFILMTEVFQDQVTEIPRVGRSIERAIDRFATYENTWYTAPGWWSTRAHWIAAGFYGEGREVYLSNLHSDLAYIALMQSWGLRRALVVLAVFTLLAGSLLAAGERCIDAAGGLVKRVGRFAEDLPSAVGDELGEQAEADARRWAAVGYFCYFAAFYVVSEVVVHVGTCFNTLPQTGITLPWISSGGSAAIGFALLVGVALGLVARASAEELAGDDLDGRRQRAQEVLGG